VTFARPVAARWGITQDFNDSYSAERIGWLDEKAAPDRGKRAPFTGGVKKTHLHLGIDYGCPTGTPVVAVHDGVIVDQGTDSDGAVFIVLRIRRTLLKQVDVIYYHLKPGTFRFTKGAKVLKGQVLALSDNTGLSSGPHLHVSMVVGPRLASVRNYGWWLWMHYDMQPFIDGKYTLSRIAPF